MTWQEMSGAKGGGREKLFPPGEAVEGVPLPIPPTGASIEPCGAAAPDFPFGGLSPRPVLGPLVGLWGQRVDGGLRKGPRHLTPGCRLRSRCSLRPTLAWSRHLLRSKSANAAPRTAGSATRNVSRKTVNDKIAAIPGRSNLEGSARDGLRPDDVSG